MSKIAYVTAPYNHTVHVSVSTEKFLGFDLHEVTVCGTKVPPSGWREAPRPTEAGFESDYNRCKRCDRKRIEGVPAFDYEEELAGRNSIHDPLPDDEPPGSWGPTPAQEEAWDAREAEVGHNPADWPSTYDPDNGLPIAPSCSHKPIDEADLAEHRRLNHPKED